MKQKTKYIKTDYQKARRDRERLLKIKELHQKQGKILSQVKVS